ncbi:hypothetical protein GBO85_02540 [Pediococcus acidilactici]|uniref:hypothetical protein n=1 Tax=Pediococcus acidilactici TaxID=1254 RepID=UPI0013301076|nr:hypothetical protein [Pediococcus acidilactici]KAF0353792.1 hypothetical protein GBO47_07575 [Pediococcus acidilactici]KAF0358131.1 hypothetical protein GBO51_07560 [Pediococcus acidilactici]KAF0428262.1 hypothetical protein GBO85_02540 [Pediococcus acidilactici]KAF0447000.1 hypothetical protein GBO97_07565 [Pediococcus acidilactici]KAF0557332.1 hypothetical protein GBP47_07535 [Pediococcus acidilactici]
MSTKIVQLEARADEPDIGLVKGEPFYVITSADAVAGLDKFIAKQVVTYQPATEMDDGLMAATDKKKLNKIKTEPFEGIKFKSPDGSIFVLSVDNEGEPVFTKEDING